MNYTNDARTHKHQNAYRCVITHVNSYTSEILFTQLLYWHVQDQIIFDKWHVPCLHVPASNQPFFRSTEVQ